MADIWGIWGSGYGVWTPSPRGRVGFCGITAHNLALKIFPKKWPFLRLNDLVNFHNFIFSQKNDLFYDLVYFYDFYPISFQKNWHFPIPTPSYFKKASRKNFSRKFSNFVHTIKKQFSILLFLFYKWKP